MEFKLQAFDDLTYWVQRDRKKARRILQLLDAVRRESYISPTYVLQQLPQPPFVEVVERPPLFSTTLVVLVTFAILIFGTMLAIPIAPTF